MDQIDSKGWFHEKNDLWPGQMFSLEVHDILHHERSEYQEILIIKSKSHGTVLILDGIIQCTEIDEFTYQEMIAFLPLCSHTDPENVLIIGGGDGGVAREVSKHPQVKRIVQVEIDKRVVEASKQYLPFMAKGFDSVKLELKICDGFEYLKKHASQFDVIITDSSDPVGPAVNLFTDTYFGLLKNAIKPDGIICSQADTIWNNKNQVKRTFENCKKHFPNLKYAVTSVPTYPTGQIGFIIGTTGDNDLSVPTLNFNQNQIDDMNLRYYNSDIHKAAFTLPNFVKKILI